MLHSTTIFCIIAIFLPSFPQINSYGSSFYNSFYIPTTPPYPDNRRVVLQEPGLIIDYGESPTQRDPGSLTAITGLPASRASQVGDYSLSTSFNTNPGQGYVNRDTTNQRFIENRDKIQHSRQINPEPRDATIHHEGSFFPQVNPDLKYLNYHTHHIHEHNPKQDTFQYAYQDRAPQYQVFNREPFQQSSSNPVPISTLPISSGQRDQGAAAAPAALPFKVQRNPEGKLNVVFNESVGISRNSEDRPLPTNPSRRSTVKTNSGSDSSSSSNSSSTTSSNARPTKPSNQGQPDIIFPDDATRKQHIKPQCAKPGDYFCTEVQNYPAAHVQAAITAELDKYQQLFGDDLVIPQSPNITQRIDVPGEESLCVSVEKLIYPQAGLTKENNWSFIINQENYTQGIRIEECLNAGKPCAMADIFPNGYTTECRQSYIYRQLLSVNPTDGRVVKDLFRLPSCCKCIIKTSQRFRRHTTTKDDDTNK